MLKVKKRLYCPIFNGTQGTHAVLKVIFSSIQYQSVEVGGGTVQKLQQFTVTGRDRNVRLKYKNIAINRG